MYGTEPRERPNPVHLEYCSRMLGFLLSAGVLVGSCGCGSERIDTSPMKATWVSYYSEHFVFYYPPDSPRKSRMTSFAASCEEIFTHVFGVLQVEPDEQIDFFVLTTDVQSDSLLGRPAGFFAPALPAIFLRVGQHPGGFVARAGCYFIDKKTSSFEVLETGMHQLYARPSVNVHAATFGFERKNRFIPLVELANTTLANDAAVYAAEAASLCAFLLAKHGPEPFKMLWRSVLGFTESIERIYGVELGDFEKQWQEYYRRESGRT